MTTYARWGAVFLALGACARGARKEEVRVDAATAQFASVSGEIRHREGRTLSAPAVALWDDSGRRKLHEVSSRLAADTRSASFLSRPLPPGFYRVRVTSPRCAILEKPVEITAQGTPPALEFLLEDSREHRRAMAVRHYRAGMAHLAGSRFKEAAGEFSKSGEWDSFFEPLPRARELLVRARDRARAVKAKKLEKSGRLAGAYFELGRLQQPSPANREKREELRRRIARRSGLIVAVADFSDTPSAPGHGLKLRRLLAARLSRGVPGLTPAPGPKTAETIRGRGVGFDSALMPAEAARLLSAVRADVIVLARALSFEAAREGTPPPVENARQAGRMVRVPNPEYQKWRDQASRIKRSAPVREEDADLVSQLSARMEDQAEKERFEMAAGKSPPEFIEKEGAEGPEPQAPPAAKSAKLRAAYRLITAEGISPAEEGAESAEKIIETIVAKLMELVRAKAGPFLGKALELKAAGDGEQAVEEAANALMVAPEGPENAQARALLKELLP